MTDLPAETSFATLPRPYINHSVEFKQNISREERSAILEQVGYNVFFFPSDHITGCDMLSDSGTTSMTNEQWAALHLGDEAYGSNRGYFKLLDVVRSTFGEAFVHNPSVKGAVPLAFLFHQGRAAEHAIFSVIGSLGKQMIIPSNGHFDTTEANIQANSIEARNLFSHELMDPASLSHFKGNMEIERLRSLLQTDADRIPVIYLTITNNTGGGQPVALQNIREVAALAHEYEIPLFIDACRFAENAWFIKQFEQGYAQRSIQEIIHEIFSYADGFTISFKKDGLVNMGGGLFLRADGLFVRKYPQLPDALTNHQILIEGHPTYGGMSGRDLMALSVGLNMITHEEYLTYRIEQVNQFGSAMQAEGLPVITPIGGHAVYLDMNKFFQETTFEAGDFGGISFTATLLAGYGHRACELGNFAFGSFDAITGKETFPEVNYVRFAIPRLRYEQQDLAHVVASVKAIYHQRDQLAKTVVEYGKALPLRHFKARFSFH